ncbi:hypothetical protein JCM8208_002971, partial [Rhodotorula glutinis]
TDLDWVATGVVSKKIAVHDAIPHLFSNAESGRDPAKQYYTAEGYETVALINDAVLELAVDEGTLCSSYGKEIINLVLNSESLIVVPVPVAGLWRTTEDELKPVELRIFHLRRKDEPEGRGTILVHHHAPSLFSGGHSRLDQVWYQDAAVAALSFLAPAGAELPTPGHYYERAYTGLAQDEDAAAQIAIEIGRIATAEVERGEPLEPSERTRLFPIGDRFLRRWLRNNAAAFESAQLRLASGERVRPWWLPSSLVASEAQLAKLVMLERAAATQRERRAAALANGELYGPDRHAANLEAARAKGKLYGPDRHAANLEAARAKGKLYGRDLTAANLEKARAEGKIVGPDRHAANLEAARAKGELYGRDLQGANLEKARAKGELYGPDLRAARPALQRANLEAARAEGKVVSYDLRAANAQRQRDETFLALSPSSTPIVKLDRVVNSGGRIATLGGPALRQLCGQVGLSDSCRVAGFRQMASGEQMSGWLEAVRAEVHGRAARGPCADGEEPAQTLVACIKSDELERTRQRAQEAAQQEAPVVRVVRRPGLVDWKPLDHAGAQDIVSRIFDADGGEDVRRWIGDSGEPLLPQVFASQYPAMSVHESWQLNKRRDAYRQRFLSTYLATSTRPNAQTDRPIDAIVCPMCPHLAAPHLDSPRPAGLITYTTVWSLLDLPCYTVPVGVVDPVLDAKPPPGAHAPQSETDRLNWDSYSPEASANAPIVLQVVSPWRFREDELLGLGEVIERALGRA